MNLGSVLSLFAAIIGVALVSVAVTSPNTANIITAFGNTFSGALRTSMGR